MSHLFEHLRADLSTTFNNLPDDQIERNTAVALGRIAECFDLEQVTLYELSEAGTELVPTIWDRNGAVAPPVITRAADPFRWTMLLDRSGVIAASDPASAQVWTASVPLRVGGERIGALRLASTTHELSWTVDLHAQLTALAEILSGALLRKRMARALRQARTSARKSERRFRLAAEDAFATLGGRLMEAQEQERKRIAGQLQDDVCQRLTALAIDLHQLKRECPQVEIQARSEDLFNRTVDIASDVQVLSHELHSSKLEYLGIVAAIKGFCEEFAHQQPDATIDFTFGGVPTHLPGDVSLCVFRVMQEGLRNALKHSGVRHVEVMLEGTQGVVRLTIADRGRGFQPEAAINGPGLGLLSMHERVNRVKGSILVVSEPGAGTEINMRIPVDAGHEGRRATTGARQVYRIPADRGLTP